MLGHGRAPHFLGKLQRGALGKKGHWVMHGIIPLPLARRGAELGLGLQRIPWLPLDTRESAGFPDSLPQDRNGPLPGSALNFSPNLPNSSEVWEALWEAAGTLAGLQLQFSFETVGTSEGGGVAGQGGGIRATIQKDSPAKDWPERAPAAATPAQQGTAAAAGAGGQQAQQEQQQEQQQQRRGRGGGAKHRSIKWEPSGTGNLVQMAKGALLVGAGFLLHHLLMRRASRG